MQSYSCPVYLQGRGNYMDTRIWNSDQEMRLPSWCVDGHILLLACEGNVWFGDSGCNKESSLFFWSSKNLINIDCQCWWVVCWCVFLSHWYLGKSISLKGGNGLRLPVHRRVTIHDIQILHFTIITNVLLQEWWRKVYIAALVAENLVL